MIEVLYYLAACAVIAWMVGEWRGYRRRRRIRLVLDEMQQASMTSPVPTFEDDYEWRSERGIR